MNILETRYDVIDRLIYGEGLRIESLSIESHKDQMVVHLNNGLTLIARISLFKRLKQASAHELSSFKLIADGTGIHWPEVDEDLSLKGLLEEYLRQKVNSASQLIIN